MTTSSLDSHTSLFSHDFDEWNFLNTLKSRQIFKDTGAEFDVSILQQLLMMVSQVIHSLKGNKPGTHTILS